MSGGAVVNYQPPTVVETLSGLTRSGCLPASGSVFPVGLSIVTCTAPDLAGNTGSATFTVRVNPAPDGRMFGHGHIDTGKQHHHFVFQVSQRRQRDDVRLEYWVTNPRSCSDDDADDDRDRDGDHDRNDDRNHQHALSRFEATSVTGAVFSDDPAFRTGPPTRSAVDSVRFSGLGTWDGRSGYTFEAVGTDQGEPGRHRDTFSIVIRDSQGSVVARVSGALDGGNIHSAMSGR